MGRCWGTFADISALVNDMVGQLRARQGALICVLVSVLKCVLVSVLKCVLVSVLICVLVCL
jgi:hypothetical protein